MENFQNLKPKDLAKCKAPQDMTVDEGASEQ